jgi:hypothetical protein
MLPPPVSSQALHRRPSSSLLPHAPSPNPSSTSTSKVRLRITLERELFVAGQTVRGTLEVDVKGKKVALESVGIELNGLEGEVAPLPLEVGWARMKRVKGVSGSAWEQQREHWMCAEGGRRGRRSSPNMASASSTTRWGVQSNSGGRAKELWDGSEEARSFCETKRRSCSRCGLRRVAVSSFLERY